MKSERTRQQESETRQRDRERENSPATEARGGGTWCDGGRAESHGSTVQMFSGFRCERLTANATQTPERGRGRERGRQRCRGGRHDPASLSHASIFVFRSRACRRNTTRDAMVIRLSEQYDRMRLGFSRFCGVVYGLPAVD